MQRENRKPRGIWLSLAFAASLTACASSASDVNGSSGDISTGDASIYLFSTVHKH